MVRIEYDRFGLYYQNKRSMAMKVIKPRQEICAPLKWFCFSLNCLIFITGVTLLTLGVYLWIKEPRAVSAVEDVVLNPSAILAIGGLFVSVVSLTGLFGALRDNAYLLKISVWLCAMGYIAIVVGVFLIFLLFYADSAEIFSMNSILLYALKRYHINHNMADMVDYVQENFECCGIRSLSQGYRDWQQSEQFFCNHTNVFANPFPERCGVPFSCCRKNVQNDGTDGSGSLIPAMRSLQCWQNAQTKRPQEVESDIYIRGCMGPLRQSFESRAVLIGSSVALALIPGIFYMFFQHVLTRQIEYQHFLLDREARRNERRRRREIAKRDKLVNAMEKGTAKPTDSQPIYTEPQSPKRSTERESRNRHSSLSPRRTLAAKPPKAKNAERRERSAMAVLSPNAADPTGRVRQWVLQQSDFVNKTASNNA